MIQPVNPNAFTDETDYLSPNHTSDVWVPTPEEIAAECAKIRADWSEAEFRKRAGVRHTIHWIVPEVRVAEWAEN
jgi:hypothetical protein